MGFFSGIVDTVKGVFDAGKNIIGGVTGLLGEAAPAISYYGNAQTAAMNQEQFEKNLLFQQQMATQGIRWRVNDAVKAGLHPLAALGAQVGLPSPVITGDTSTGTAMAQLGQDLSRAMHSTRTADERSKAFADLQLENQSLQNDLLRTQIASQVAKVSQAGGNPPMPSIGEVVDPSRRTAAIPGQPHTERAISPANKLFLNRDGTVTNWPSSDAKQAVEDSLYEYEHMYRNRLLPVLAPIGDAYIRVRDAVRPVSRSPYIWKQ